MTTKDTALTNGEPQALTTAGPQALEAAPDYITKSRRGFEDTVQSDLSIPRLALAQNGSPQVTDGDPNRIEGLKVGEMFNSVTNQVYGKEVFVQLLRKMPLRAMEFNPIDDGGGVKDPDVPLDDDRCQWHGDEKPVATVFRDFLAVLLPSREFIALSFKSSGIKAAKNLWGLATMAGRDCFAVRLRISTGPKLTPKPHQVYKVDQAGWVSQVDFSLGADQFEAVQTIDATKIHRDPNDDPDAFDTVAMDAKPSDM